MLSDYTRRRVLKTLGSVGLLSIPGCARTPFFGTGTIVFSNKTEERLTPRVKISRGDRTIFDDQVEIPPAMGDDPGYHWMEKYVTNVSEGTVYDVLVTFDQYGRIFESHNIDCTEENRDDELWLIILSNEIIRKDETC